MARKLLLISNSTNHGEGYLDHVPARRSTPSSGRCGAWSSSPSPCRTAPATAPRCGRASRPTASRWRPSPRTRPAPRLARRAEAVFVGGGNTFRLLKTLQDSGLLPRPRERARRGGMPYLGTSAGTNIAAPTIRTTNDMPIVEPASFARPGGWSPSRSTRTTWTPTRLDPHGRDPRAAALASSTRRTRPRSSACARGAGCASATAPSSWAAGPPPGSSAAATPRSSAGPASGWTTWWGSEHKLRRRARRRRRRKGEEDEEGDPPDPASPGDAAAARGPGPFPPPGGRDPDLAVLLARLPHRVTASRPGSAPAGPGAPGVDRPSVPALQSLPRTAGTPAPRRAR